MRTRITGSRSGRQCSSQCSLSTEDLRSSSRTFATGRCGRDRGICDRTRTAPPGAGAATRVFSGRRSSAPICALASGSPMSAPWGALLRPK